MRKKKELKRIENWFFGSFGLQRIKIIYANAPALVDPEGNYCFGCYVYDETRSGVIWVSYGIGKWGIIRVLFHELAHYMQDRRIGLDKYDGEKAEEEAEKMADELLVMWIKRRWIKRGKGDKNK